MSIAICFGFGHFSVDWLD